METPLTLTDVNGCGLILHPHNILSCSLASPYYVWFDYILLNNISTFMSPLHYYSHSLPPSTSCVCSFTAGCWMSLSSGIRLCQVCHKLRGERTQPRLFHIHCWLPVHRWRSLVNAVYSPSFLTTPLPSSSTPIQMCVGIPLPIHMVQIHSAHVLIVLPGTEQNHPCYHSTFHPFRLFSVLL